MMAERSNSARKWLRLVPGSRPVASSHRVEDEAIIEAIEQGDRGLGNQIYDRLIRVVDSTLFKIVGKRDPDYDDLVQASFEQIVTTIARRKYAKACSLSSWAAAVTCNVALNAVRRRISQRKYMDAASDVDEVLDRSFRGVDLERQLTARDELASVRRKLAQMSVERSETLLLHDMLGHDLSEIAVLTGVSVAAAQSRLVRGRRELARRLEEDTAEEEES
jgi:RNA polymerase sigma-70 factor (ECF subfamily)